jgi:hypothetical protein
MRKYLLLPMISLLFANCVQAQLEWGYQCKLIAGGHPEHAANVQRIDMFPGGAIVKVRDDSTGEFGGSGKVYKELANTEYFYVIGVLVSADTINGRSSSGHIVYPVIEIDKRTLAYNATAMTPQHGDSSNTSGTCRRLTI